MKIKRLFGSRNRVLESQTRPGLMRLHRQVFACLLLNQFCKQLRGSNTSATFLHRGSGSAASFSLAARREGVFVGVFRLAVLFRASWGAPPRLCGLRCAPLAPVCHQLINASIKSPASQSFPCLTAAVTSELTPQRHHLQLRHLPPGATVYCCFVLFSVSFY